MDSIRIIGSNVKIEDDHERQISIGIQFPNHLLITLDDFLEVPQVDAWICDMGNDAEEEKNILEDEINEKEEEIEKLEAKIESLEQELDSALFNLDEAKASLAKLQPIKMKRKVK